MATKNWTALLARVRTVIVVLVFGTGTAYGACPINVGHLRVGDDTTYCNYGDIQAAINAVANSCPVIIDITRRSSGATYTGQSCDPGQPDGCHLTIGGKNVTLQGHGADASCYTLTQCIPACLPPSDTLPLITLDNGNSAGRVLTVTGGGNVNIRNLTVTHGLATADDKGGGIYYSGAGNLNIARSTISYNYAGIGGGIAVEGTGGTANLRLLDYALVLSNTAQNSGGGIYVSGTAVLFAQQTPALIGLNDALGEDPITHDPVGGYGGGVDIDAPASADIGSSGINGLGVIYGNSAVSGGGLALVAGAQNGGFANLYTTDPAHPVTIQGNFASSRGGAIYSKGYANALDGDFNEATTCVSNGRIVDNAAPDGAIAYLDWDTDDFAFPPDVGSNLYINTSICGSASVGCPSGSTCNQMYDNVSSDANANPAPGSAIVVGKASSLEADKLDLRRSTGVHMLVSFGRDVLLRSCLLADNNVSDALIVDGMHTLNVDSCTIAGNVIGGSAAVTNGANAITNSLVFQPGLAVGSFDQASYVLANDPGGLPASATVNSLADPKFVDAANSNYNLQTESAAVDYAPALGGTDLDGKPRDADLPTHANTFGPRDLGAYEIQNAFACDLALDVIFCASFE